MTYVICIFLFIISAICVHKLNELTALFWKSIIPSVLALFLISSSFWYNTPSPPSQEIQLQEFEEAYSKGYTEATIYHSENYSPALAEYRAEDDAKKDFEKKYPENRLYEIGYDDGAYDRKNGQPNIYLEDSTPTEFTE